ncbi:hypothetical protein FGLOB1_13578 [Fusarium globosum]|uniref:Uncharacterized protein n=1 Tax=Fusarium globosum TaxID=78864 RepID=A0A8H6CY80_9HYPO|nr:hypothetical protein FGLOB1_13578 [Fusarium globosum]
MRNVTVSLLASAIVPVQGDMTSVADRTLNIAHHEIPTVTTKPELAPVMDRGLIDDLLSSAKVTSHDLTDNWVEGKVSQVRTAVEGKISQASTAVENAKDWATTVIGHMSSRIDSAKNGMETALNGNNDGFDFENNSTVDFVRHGSVFAVMVAIGAAVAGYAIV